MPQHRVLRLEDPVVLVGEMEQARRHAPALEGGEHGQSLDLADPVVQGPVDDQGRDAPCADVVKRIVFRVARGVLPRGPAMLPLREPQLLRREVGEPLVEIAVVTDQAAPRLVPDAGDEVDHVTAEARTQGRGAGRIKERVSLEGGRVPLLEVLERLPAPVVADRIREGLAVPGRAVEVDHDDRVPGARVDLRVPTVVPVVPSAPLRPAVDDEGDGIPTCRVEAGRLHHVPVDGLAIPAGERELLGVADIEIAQPRGVQPGDSPRAPAGEDVEVGRAGQRIEAVEDRIADGLRLRYVAVRDERRNRTSLDVQGEQAALTCVLGQDVERAPVGRPLERAGAAVPAVGQAAGVAVRPAAQRDRQLVGLVSGPIHRQIRQERPVRTERRVGVGRGVLGREVPGR